MHGKLESLARLRARTAEWKALAPWVATGLAFVVLFWEPMRTLLRDWWTDPEAAHGLLLGPLALFLAWHRGRAPEARPQPGLGLVMLAGAVLLRYLSGLAAELFTLRMSMLGAAMALVVLVAGIRQLVHWWLPALLLVLCVPVPVVVLGSLSFPLQLKASQLGATLLESRHVPVELAGNVIHLPGRSLFVTEACSGLRSLTALLSLGLLIGGLWLASPWTRILLVVVTVPVAVLLNGIRVFLMGFLAFFVTPGASEGFMHYTEGWVLFVVAFAMVGVIAWVFSRLERRWRSRT